MQVFYARIVDDAKINPSHISIYMALLKLWTGDLRTPVEFCRQDIMLLAKVSARHTYNKCMNELMQYGYIEYMPSNGRGVESLAYFKMINEESD